MSKSILFSALHKALERPIAFHRVFATVGGGATEGLFLSQAYYWSQRTNDKDGWFYKGRDEWTTETALTRREQESARKKLKGIGVLEEKTEGLPCKLFFRVNIDSLFSAIASIDTTNSRGYQLVQSDQLAGTIVPTSETAEPVDITLPNLSNPRGCQLVQSDQLESHFVPTRRSDVTGYIYTEITTEITNRENIESALSRHVANAETAKTSYN